MAQGAVLKYPKGALDYISACLSYFVIKIDITFLAQRYV